MKVTILTCTPDIKSRLFERHSSLLKKHTNNFEWLIFDNNNFSGFNHARDINRAISIASGKYLITLDDDLMVTNGWIDGLLKLAKSAKIVGGIHRDENNKINHAGGYILPNGFAGHYLGALKKDINVQYVCSAVMLIDLEFIKKHQLYFDERFYKYFHDADFCLRVWQSGGSVAVTKKCDVFHFVGQVANKRSDRYKLYGLDSKYFNQKWVETKELRKLMSKNKINLDSSYYKSIETMGDLLLEYNKALKIHDTKKIEKINNEAKVLIDYGHGKKIFNESKIYLQNIK